MFKAAAPILHPISAEGLNATKARSGIGIRIHVTLVVSAIQALLAAKATVATR